MSNMINKNYSKLSHCFHTRYKAKLSTKPTNKEDLTSVLQEPVSGDVQGLAEQWHVGQVQF